MHALAVLVHEFAHYRFVTNKRLNDWVGDITVGWPLMTTIDGYRNNHLAHHRYTNTDKDPDWVIKLGKRKFTFPKKWQEALIDISSYLLVFGSIMDLAMVLPRLRKRDDSNRSQKIARILFYAGIAVLLTVTGTWIGFVIYWLLPFFTVFFLLNYIRSVAEHFGDLEYGDELTDTRTVIPFFWENWFLSPHYVNFHLEHHLYPSVPYFRLPELHAELMKDERFAGQAHITRGYSVGLIRECLTWGGKRGSYHKPGAAHRTPAE